METKENLYGFLSEKVNKNNVAAIEEKRRELILDEYHDEEKRYTYLTMQVKAYYCYKYFIEKILPFYIKNQIDSSFGLSLECIKDDIFDFTLTVIAAPYYGVVKDEELAFRAYKDKLDYEAKEAITIHKSKNRFYITFRNQFVYYYFILYMELFCERTGLNIYCKNSNHNQKSFAFDHLTINNILDFYYRELQGLEYIDANALIEEMKMEENISVDGDEVERSIVKK